MTAWKKALLSICSIAFALALSLMLLSLALSFISSEKKLKQEGIYGEDFDRNYEKTFSCGTVSDCITNWPDEGIGRVVLSRAGHDYFSRMHAYMIVFSLAILIAIVFLAETWPGRLKATGIPFLMAGLSISGAAALKGVISTGFTEPQIQNLFSSTMPAFYTYYGILIAAGIALTISGILMAKKEIKTDAGSTEEE